MQYPEFVQRMAAKHINAEVVDKIRDEMEARGYSKNIIQQVRAEFVAIDDQGWIDFDIISDYEADGFDVAKMMEMGRRRYFIQQVKKKALHWIIMGISFFSRGHWIPERPADKIVAKGIKDLAGIAQDRLNEDTDNFLKHQLGSQ